MDVTLLALAMANPAASKHTGRAGRGMFGVLASAKKNPVSCYKALRITTAIKSIDEH
jgi:hypothetical protein